MKNRNLPLFLPIFFTSLFSVSDPIFTVLILFLTHFDSMRLSSIESPLYEDQGDIWFCLRPAASGTTF